MKKIFSIGTFGNVVEIEKDNTVEHNDMIATAFQDFFQNLSEEERKDDGAILFLLEKWRCSVQIFTKYVISREL